MFTNSGCGACCVASLHAVLKSADAPNTAAPITKRTVDLRIPTPGSKSVGNHSGRVSARMRIRPRCWIDGGYARGNESFETLTVERLGRFKADTFSAGFRVDTRALQSIIVAGEYQITDRNRLFRLTLGFVERF